MSRTSRGRTATSTRARRSRTRRSPSAPSRRRCHRRAIAPTRGPTACRVARPSDCARSSVRSATSPSQTARSTPRSGRSRCRPSDRRCTARNRPLAARRRNHTRGRRTTDRMDRAGHRIRRRRSPPCHPAPTARRRTAARCRTRTNRSRARPWSAWARTSRRADMSPAHTRVAMLDTKSSSYIRRALSIGARNVVNAWLPSS